VRLINYGGIITHLKVPDKKGTVEDVVLGHNNMEGYEQESDYFGAIIGRYANRIENGHFTLNGKQYDLPQNNLGHSLHGGKKGFDKRLWQAQSFTTQDSAGVVLSYTSPDGEEGYPGKLSCRVRYALYPDNALHISYWATTTKPTILNLTNHSYFNLKDAGASKITDHVLQINANRYTPVDSTLIPTGRLEKVTGTPFDFREPTPIGERINQKHPQLQYANGYDHNFVLNKTSGKPALAARVHEPTSGRVLEVFTTEPGMQFYSGNFLDGSYTGKHDINYEFRSGFCLETQHFPNSPNEPDFPSVVLEPTDTFRSKTIYRFRTK